MSIIISRDFATGAYWCMANKITLCNCHVVGLCLHLTNISAVNMKSDSNNTTSFVDARAWLKSVTTCGHLCNNYKTVTQHKVAAASNKLSNITLLFLGNYECWSPPHLLPSSL